MNNVSIKIVADHEFDKSEYWIYQRRKIGRSTDLNAET